MAAQKLWAIKEDSDWQVCHVLLPKTCPSTTSAFSGTLLHTQPTIQSSTDRYAGHLLNIMGQMLFWKVHQDNSPAWTVWHYPHRWSIPGLCWFKRWHSGLLEKYRNLLLLLPSVSRYFDFTIATMLLPGQGWHIIVVHNSYLSNNVAAWAGLA